MKMVVTFELLGFWKFSRNRLVDIQSRQAIIPILNIFWVPARNRLAVS